MTSAQPGFVPPGYEIVRFLGAGRSAQAWLARHASFGDVVLKIPRAGAREPLLKRMFENEVKLTLDLRHPNIVRGFEGVPSGSTAYLTLEWCPGGSLESAGAASWPLEQRLTLLQEVMTAVEFMHSHGYLHRDIKPANVLLDSTGRCRLADLGSGAHHAAAGFERVGTVYYMAPELFEGGRATFSSDVYSLAVLAYELLAGERPFQGSSYEEVQVAHRSGMRRSLVRLNPDVSTAVARVIAAAMNADVGKRLATVREFREAFALAGRASAPEVEDKTPTVPQETGEEKAGRGIRALLRRLRDGRS